MCQRLSHLRKTHIKDSNLEADEDQVNFKDSGGRFGQFCFVCCFIHIKKDIVFRIFFFSRCICTITLFFCQFLAKKGGYRSISSLLDRSSNIFMQQEEQYTFQKGLNFLLLAECNHLGAGTTYGIVVFSSAAKYMMFYQMF